ncbi:hypothetical protein [uncultured Devosia sp.]|uniref:hypothetical protein n=1 Tax=uncultured Devosia sp. TaxID=211434 RepID=UPI0026328E37|nr:hypothetical protein [uncultured Devosia sp.]
MQSDEEIMLSRVQSETLGALLSIQSYREIAPAYFDRLRAAVLDAVAFFGQEPTIPEALFEELAGAERTLRNEATAFPGRTVACVDMADWLAEQRKLIRSL